MIEEEDIEPIGGACAVTVGLALGAVLLVGAFAVLAGGCYAHNGPPPPSCAEDPTQPWCVPPPFDSAHAEDAGAHDGGRR